MSVPPLPASVPARWLWASPSCHSVWQWSWGHHEGQSERDNTRFLLDRRTGWMHDYSASAQSISYQHLECFLTTVHAVNEIFCYCWCAVILRLPRVKSWCAVALDLPCSPSQQPIRHGGSCAVLFWATSRLFPWTQTCARNRSFELPVG